MAVESIQEARPEGPARVLDLGERLAARRRREGRVGPEAAPDGAGRDLRVMAVCSGKGGVGKTNLVVNLGVALQRLGRRVIVLDADLGLANVDTLLGLQPSATLRDVLLGECPLTEALLAGPEGIRIVPASSGFDDVTQLSGPQRLHLLEEFDQLEEDFDVLLIDTGAGISSNVTFFAVAANEILLVVTPEPTALTDAYALIKVLSRRYAERDFGVIVNMTRGSREGEATWRHLSRVTERFLGVSLHLAGIVPFDGELPTAVRRQRPLLDLAPTSPAARSIERLARGLLAAPPEKLPKGGLQFFFERLLSGEGR